MLVVLATAAIGWAAFVQQILVGQPFGEEPASDIVVWLLFVALGVAMPALFLSVTLVTEVVPGELRVRFPPFPPRRVALDDVLVVQTVSYRPVAEWGGWGYRINLRGGRAFTVSGNRGIRLALPAGRILLVGSQRPDELLAAIEAARRR